MMRVILSSLLFCLLALTASAEKAPAVRQFGSDFAASHLLLHTEAYTEGWDGLLLRQKDGSLVSPLADDGCEDYGHVHCYGNKVSLWDTPMRGENRVPYMPGTQLGNLYTRTEFQLVDVMLYKNRYYAMVRVMENNIVTVSGWVNADYIGCDCPKPEGGLEVYDYEEWNPVFSLK